MRVIECDRCSVQITGIPGRILLDKNMNREHDIRLDLCDSCLLAFDEWMNRKPGRLVEP